MKQFILGIVVALATMGVMAEISNTVRVTKFHQSYPYSSKATVEYTVGGALLEGAVAEITLNTDDASATFIQSNIVTGANAFMIDFASSFGGALLLTNASFVVTIVGAGHGGTEEDYGGVQLWEKGPYWAECNVGASKPEEYGYYFWWGDTVGYKRENDAWVATDGSSSNFSFNFYNTPTCAKDIASLQSEGWIVWQNGAYVLVPAHDAAHVKWGGEWRMPTQQEENDLNINCDWTWTTKNGVNGYEVRGRGDYASNSIFLPCAGYGYETSLNGIGLEGYFCTSVPHSHDFSGTYTLHFNANIHSYMSDYNNFRGFGFPVRPVRGFADVVTVGIVTYDLPETQTTVVPIPYAWLRAYYPAMADECEAYEAAAKKTAANGQMSVAGCYVLGLDPQVATNDFRIASFPMKTDGTPDFANVAFDPPQEQWNVPDASVVWKGAEQLEGPWRTVREEVGRGVPPSSGGSPGTARSTMRFFKAVVLDDANDVMVQLWEGGPYWATMNVGAEEPWDYGYYFWWGDTVGYTRNGGTWDGTSYSEVTWVSSTGEQMSTSPFLETSCPTYGKDNLALLSAGYIDSTGNLVPEHDAAQVHWGGEWRMPTDAEMASLVSNCTSTYITTNGVSGRLVTGKGDYANRSIFLPAAGFGYDSSLTALGWNGFYRSSTPFDPYESCCDRGFYFDIGSLTCWIGHGRYNGQPVRPVRNDGGTANTYTVTYKPGANGSGSQQTATKTHDVALTLKGATFTRSGYTQMGWATSDGGSKAYDLGAFYTSNVSITLYPYWIANSGSDSHDMVQLWEGGPYWATKNVGAEEPWDYGYYFWWGDTVGYKRENDAWVTTDGSSSNFSFDSSNTPTCDKDTATLQSEGWIVSQDDTYVLAPEHDAAYVHWGGNWRMPTDAEQSALKDICDWTYTTKNGVNGYEVRGRGDYASNSIFLPCAGFGNGTSLSNAGSDGDYWSSVPLSDYYNGACYLYFTSSLLHFYYHERYFGRSVRPVRGFAQ